MIVFLTPSTTRDSEKITASMIEVGGLALEHFRDSYFDQLLVETVYTAMAAAKQLEYDRKSPWF